MPANILKLMLPGPSMGAVHLGTVKNPQFGPPKQFSDTMTIIQAGMPPISNLALPMTFDSCDWATIAMAVRVKAPIKPVMPIPGPLPAVMPIPWLPPPAPPLMFTPWLAAGPGVTAVRTTVGMPLPGTPGTPPFPGGVLDCLSMPGSTYEIQFNVLVLPGVYGLKSWQFDLTGASGKVATIAVSANLIDPDIPENQ